MSTVLITGANRGIGLEFARQYAAEGWNVIACCRSPQKAAELQALVKTAPLIRVEALEVTDNASIAALVAKLKDVSIDLLINNAGIYSGASPDATAITGDRSQEFGSIDAAAWAKVLQVNTIAPIMITQAFVPQLKQGSGKKVVNISSRMGSLAQMKEGAVAYRSSKAALNGAMRAIADTLRPFGISVVNFHPGWVQTDMGSSSADLKTEDSVKQMRGTIAKLKAADSGQFINYDGHIIPW